MNQLVPLIICEEKEEEQMTSNLRAEFRERQRKCLSESIYIDPSSSNKAHSTLKLDSPSKPTSLTPIAIVILGPDEKPSFIGDISYHEMRKPFVVLGNISEDSFECPNFSPFRPKANLCPSKEKIFKFLSLILYFTE
ncbi:hypothetical protein PVL29_002359 [Vitis rotundifolia]|uniref:Uncharacterized protein n=1 Tax=Vitis rotundifolia TaxID=103349 RepID=A0AA39AHW8_VITRO|nr:hypothetical protein PVL29_002359 [Vitis rotundifolia]